MRTPPKQYQREDALRIEQFGGSALLAGEPGTGKTYTSWLWASRNVRARPVLIVCPATLKHNWQRELSVHFGVRAEILGTTRPPDNWLTTPHECAIINYEVLGPWMPYLLAMRPKLVMFDECHRLGSLATQATNNCFRITRDAQHVIGITGTPIINRPAELYPILYMIAPEKFPAFRPFADLYCAPKMQHGKWTYNGATNLDLLNKELVETCLIRRLKKDVLHDLPVCSQTILPVDLPNPGEYKRAYNDFLSWLFAVDPLAARKASRAKALAQVNLLRQLVGRLKFNLVVEWIDDYLRSGDKLLVLGTHRDLLKRYTEHYAGKAVLVNGSIVGAKRQRAIDQFCQDRRTPLLFGNMKVAGLGLNLVAAPTVLFPELGWTSVEHTQGAARVDRIGQTRETRIVWMVAKNTIEERLLQIIQRKQSIADQAIDGLSKDAVTLTVFDQFMEEIIAQERQRRGAKHVNGNGK